MQNTEKWFKIPDGGWLNYTQFNYGKVNLRNKFLI